MKATVVLNSKKFRDQVAGWARRLPNGTIVEFRKPNRSLEQNSKLWSMLHDISNQVDWYGEKLSAEDWKTVFSAALSKSRVVPGLEGGFVVLGLRTSTMTKAEFSDLIELITAFSAERGVVFKQEERHAACRNRPAREVGTNGEAAWDIDGEASEDLE